LADVDALVEGVEAAAAAARGLEIGLPAGETRVRGDAERIAVHGTGGRRENGRLGDVGGARGADLEAVVRPVAGHRLDRRGLGDRIAGHAGKDERADLDATERIRAAGRAV